MRKFLLGAGLAALLAPAAALAQGFHVGDHVTIGSTGDTGVVIEVGPQLADGGTNVKVHLDRLGPGFPNVGRSCTSATSRVTVTASGTAPTPAAAPGGRVSTVRNTGPAPAGRDPAIPNPPGTTASGRVCQQLIRANYPPGGADQTITVNFLSFQMSGQQPMSRRICRRSRRRPHGQRRADPRPLHRADPLCGPARRRRAAHLRCAIYVLPRRRRRWLWAVELVLRAPGGETAQYIHKGYEQQAAARTDHGLVPLRIQNPTR